MLRRDFLVRCAQTFLLATATPGILHAQEEDFESLPAEYADVLVIGGGAGGLTAAITAVQAGAGKVMLLEKNSRLGGDTLISGGYFNAVLPERQRVYGIEDSIELFEQQILVAGGEINDPAVVHVLASQAGEALKWLEKQGMFFGEEIYEVFGSGWRRCFHPIMPRGSGYLRALTAAALVNKVVVKTDSQCVGLIRYGGRIMGAVYVDGSGKQRTVRTRRGVILASGGFAANRKMLGRYAPQIATLPVDSQPGSTGEMLDAAEKLGAALVNMNVVECVPGSRPDIGFAIRLDYIPSRMIMLDARGNRFVNESGFRSEVAKAILDQRGEPVWAVADSETISQYDPINQKNLYRGLYAGEVFRAHDLQDLAQAIGLDSSVFLKTMESKPARDRVQTAPFWATRMYLRVHATLGGLRINERAQVLDVKGQVIDGLWACGACTGCVHGLNRMGGNGINTAVVFGRVAGLEAAKA